MNLSDLKKPFPVEHISWRCGARTKDKTKGIGLAYIDARDLYERLDEICGVDGWQIRYPHVQGKVCCEIGIKINDEWLWKANGAGDTNIEADKGAFSDAAKRAGVPWGIGAYLYDMPNKWVPVDSYGKFDDNAIKTLQAELRKLSGKSTVQPKKDEPKAEHTPKQKNDSALKSVYKRREDIDALETEQAVQDYMTDNKDWITQIDAYVEPKKLFNDLIAERLEGIRGE